MLTEEVPLSMGLALLSKQRRKTMPRETSSVSPPCGDPPSPEGKAGGRTFRRNPAPAALTQYSYCLFPIAYCLFPIAYCLFPIAYSLLPIAYSLLPIPYCLFPIAYCLFPISDSSFESSSLSRMLSSALLIFPGKRTSSRAAFSRMLRPSLAM